MWNTFIPFYIFLKIYLLLPLQQIWAFMKQNLRRRDLAKLTTETLSVAKTYDETLSVAKTYNGR